MTNKELISQLRRRCVAKEIIQAVEDMQADNARLRTALENLTDDPPIGLDWHWHIEQARTALEAD